MIEEFLPFGEILLARSFRQDPFGEILSARAFQVVVGRVGSWVVGRVG
jgi:hypothetical protein